MVKRKRIASNIIAQQYYNTKEPAGFSGKEKLTKKLGKKVTKNELDNWLLESDTYTLHKPVRKRFARRKYIVSGIDATWQCDLTDLQSISSDNDGYKYILLCIDVFSRYAFARTVKTKSGNDISKAFSDILQTEKRRPNSLHTDKGKEFLNKEFQSLLKSNNIHHYVTENQEIKASMVERLQRTIKSKLFRYFTHTNNYRYIDELDHIIESYNKSFHSSLNMRPVDVNIDNQEELWHHFYTDMPLHTKAKFKYQIGDTVRISKYSTPFDKGYLPNWSEETFTISKRHETTPPVYSLEDYSKSELKGTWYEQELQKVKVKNDVYKIEAILGQRKVNGNVQYLVKWFGYPDSFNSYVSKKDLINSYKN